MKKVLGVCLAGLLALALAAPPASAISLPAGPVWGHLSDWTDLYRQGTAIGRFVLPQVGDEGRAIVYINQLYNANSGAVYFTPSASEELTATEYGFVIGGAIPTGGIANLWKWFADTDFNPANGFTPGYINYTAANPGSSGGVINRGMGSYELYFVDSAAGGRVDIWLDTTPDWDSAPLLGPNAWVADAPLQYWDYPLVSDVGDAGCGLWLTGSYAPLFVDVDLSSDYNPLVDPLSAFFDMNGNGAPDAGDVWALFETVSWQLGGIGTSHAWIEFDGGSFFSAIVQDALGPGYDLSLTADLHPSKYGSADPWATRSSDPTYFEVLPEPSSLALLGVALAGLIGYVQRKRREA